jgi:hypothetical protein
VRVPAAVLFLCLGPALALGQSLGDAARRQADRRAGRAPATANYTDASLDGENGQRPPDLGTTRQGHRPWRMDGCAPSSTGRPKQREESRAPVATPCLQARARVDAARRRRDAACGPGVLVLTGG